MHRIPTAGLFVFLAQGASGQTCDSSSGFVQNEGTLGPIDFVHVEFVDSDCITHPDKIALTIEPSTTDETTLSTKPAGILSGVLDNPDCATPGKGPCTLKFKYEDVKDSIENSTVEAGAVLRIAPQLLLGVTVPEQTEGSRIQINSGFTELQNIDIYGKDTSMRLASSLYPDDDSKTLSLDIEVHKSAPKTSLTVSSVEAPGGLWFRRLDSDSNVLNVKDISTGDWGVRGDISTSYNSFLIESKTVKFGVYGTHNTFQFNGATCDEPNIILHNETGNTCSETQETVTQEPFPCTMPTDVITKTGENCGAPSGASRTSLAVGLLGGTVLATVVPMMIAVI